MYLVLSGFTSKYHKLNYKGRYLTSIADLTTYVPHETQRDSACNCIRLRRHTQGNYLSLYHDCTTRRYKYLAQEQVRVQFQVVLLFMAVFPFNDKLVTKITKVPSLGLTFHIASSVVACL